MVKELLDVLMDGIKDTNMLIDYWQEAEDPDYESWLRRHVEVRMDQVMKDYEYICNRIDLKAKAKSGDEMAEAFKSHLDHEIAEIKRKVS